MNITQTIRGVFTRNHEQDRIRAYLDRSVSMADLERRQRNIDEGRLRPRSYPF